MKFEPVSRTSLSDAVFRELEARILGGEFAADAPLPSERALCAALKVNRGALREALKRLEQQGLVQIRQGGATRVVDFQREAGLDLVPSMLIGPDLALRKRAVRGLFELRSAIGPEVARSAAARRTERDVEIIDGQITQMEEEANRTPIALQRLSMAMWEQLALASDNIVYRCTYNSMRRAWEPVQDAVAAALMDELGDLTRYRKLARAVRQQNPDKASKLARELLDAGAGGMMAFLGLSNERAG